MTDFSINELQRLAALAGFPDTDIEERPHDDPDRIVLLPQGALGSSGQRRWRPNLWLDQCDEILKGLIKRGWKDGKIEWSEYGFRCLIWWMAGDDPLYDSDNMEDFSPTPAIAICKSGLQALDFECKLVREKL